MCISQQVRILLCIVLCAMPLASQALRSDVGQPIEIRADRWDHTGAANETQGTSVYTGHVVITQGSIRITAHQATLTITNEKLTNAVIGGTPATFYQKRAHGAPIQGQARTIHYDPINNMVELTDNAKVHQGGRVITAHYIRYDIAQEKIIAHHEKQRTKKRVHVVIPPDTTP